MRFRVSAKEIFLVLFAFILLADLSIIISIPFYRQFFGFILISILPGLLLSYVMGLNRVDLAERIVISVGLSFSSVMFLGLVMHVIADIIQYPKPLATESILVSYNVILVALTCLVYIRYRSNISWHYDICFTATNLDKLLPSLSLFFPLMSVIGIYLMNMYDCNYFIIFLIVCIALYVVLITIRQDIFPKQHYPLVILSISISILLLGALRSNHILGSDAHLEYQFYRATLSNLCWVVTGNSLLDGCLSISLLPTIYQSVLGVNPELLFRVLYSLLFSVAPLALFLTFKNYIDEAYSFLVSFFFMSQTFFMYVVFNPRTSMAILFVTLVVMVLFNENLGFRQKRVLILVFIVSCIISHYSTSYILLFILCGTYVISHLMRRHNTAKAINGGVLLVSAAFIYFWYAIVTAAPFRGGVTFFQRSLQSLMDAFIFESTTSEGVSSMLGSSLISESPSYWICYFSNWSTIILIGIGVLALIMHYRGTFAQKTRDIMQVPSCPIKFDMGYFIISLVCCFLLWVTILVPQITRGYDLIRIYTCASVVLSFCFIIGGIKISKFLKLSPKIFLLVIMILYFFCTSGVTYAVLETPRSVILSSQSEDAVRFIVHDQELSAGTWARINFGEYPLIYTPTRARFLVGLGFEDYQLRPLSDWQDENSASRYIFVRFTDIVQNSGDNHLPIFTATEKIYCNGGAEIYAIPLWGN